MARTKKTANPGPVGEWFTRNFVRWQNAEGSRRTVDDFAGHVGVKRGTMNQWMTGARRPKGAYVKIVADKLGPEIYDLLGLSRPVDPGQNTPLDIFKNLLTPEQRSKIEKMILDFADENARRKAKEQGSHAEVAR